MRPKLLLSELSVSSGVSSMNGSNLASPQYSDILEARDQIAGQAVRTPLLRNDVLDERLNGRIFIKAECLQRTGSFKFRGAFNRISRLTVEERKHGVIAYSSGNHAQGVSAAAKLTGTTATILMPKDAPVAKVEGVKFWGGKVVFFDRTTENREELGARIAEDENRVLVPPYEDRLIIAGQGTAALEACEDLERDGLRADIFMCPAGGGGLIAGTGLSARQHNPDAEIWAVEPENFDDYRRSLLSGKRESNAQLTGSICDAIITPMPGALTWSVNANQLTGGVTVSDDEALEAMAFAWRNLKIVAEPGGVVALAAALNGRVDLAGKTACLVISGGNVDRAMFNRALDLA
jgi:threonine dehydratase